MDVYLEKLNIEHTQMDFDCGDQDINAFFERSLDEVLLKNSQVYVLTTKVELVGFFAIAMSSIRAVIDEREHKHPVCLLCQLGINLFFQNQGFGSYLIEQVIERAMIISNNIGCKGIIVETYNKELVNGFYKNKSFIELYKITQKDGREKHILFLKFEKI